MSDYQPVYDAVYQAFRGFNAGALTDAVARNFDPGMMFPIIQQEFCIAAAEIQRPSVLFRPRLSVDGDQWCALYGDDLQDGVAGFGKSPAAAMANFDEEWAKERNGR